MTMTDEDALSELYEDMYRGMLTRDRTLLEQVLAPDFVLVHMTGMHQSREQFVAAVEDGTLRYFSAKTEGLDVRVSGSGDRATATVAGRSRVSAAVFGGGRHTWPLEQDLSCVKVAGRWQVTRSVASTY